MSDMQKDVFAEHSSGQLALSKMFPDGEVPENFLLYKGEVFNTSDIATMYTGCEFRRAKSGPRKGQLCIPVPNTEKTAFVTQKELQEYENE